MICLCIYIQAYVSVCVCVLVCIYVLGGKGKLAEPLRQVVHNSNTNSVKFLSCHRNEDGDSPLSFSQTTQHFTRGSELSYIWDFIGQKHAVSQTVFNNLDFNIFTYALTLWCYWTPDRDSLALGTRNGG